MNLTATPFAEGNTDPRAFTLKDLQNAVGDTHDLTEARPVGMSEGVMQMVLFSTSVANHVQNRQMSYESTLAWGITIGVMAERERVARTRRQGESV